jgi:hypothetical protein
LVKGYTRFLEKPMLRGALCDLLVECWPINIGVVTGGSVIVVEADSQQAEDELERLAKKVLRTTPTRERRDGRGRAYLFVGDRLVANRAHLGESKAIDVRGVGGLLVLPPSVHMTGHRYKWVRAPWDMPLAQIPDPLMRLLETPPRTRVLSIDKPVNPGISRRVQSLLAARSYLQKLFRGEGKLRGDESASGYDYALAYGLAKAGVPADEIEATIASRADGKERPDRYIHLTVTTAIARSGRSR